MTLAAGSLVGGYEVVAALGAGGMGEVYRARDTQLKRDVALKVLSETFSKDPDRVARFQREAELLAALNHPNIAAVYGIERVPDDGSAIVLELVEGETLADWIAHGPVPLTETLSIARQIADALEAAHDKGVIHRDLKPANVKVTPDGRVKVLDFGLAKMLDADSSSAVLTRSPTLSVHATYAGVILGTAAYMSPEQARGKPVDRRADIWAFGCVMFEMLTGTRPFDAGETVSDAIAAILTREPEWNALPQETPPHIRTLLRRCLQKDPKRRLPHIGIARLEIDEPAEVSAAALRDAESLASIAPPPLATRRMLVSAMSGLAVGLIAAVIVWIVRPSPAPGNITKFSIALPEGQQFTNNTFGLLGISPDGTQLAYVADRRLNLRPISKLEANPIPGSETVAGGVGAPTFSPDGQFIAFYSADQMLKKLSVHGGTAIPICPAEPVIGVSWDGDEIVYGQQSKGIMKVSQDGGTPQLIVENKD